MATASSSPTTNTNQPLSLAQSVDYNALYDALSARGILFNEEQKRKLEQIGTQELQQADIPDAGSMAYTVLAFIQNLVKCFDLHDIGHSFSEASERVGELSKLRHLQVAAEHIHARFLREVSNSVPAAELVSGVRLSSNGPNDRPEYMPNSIFGQARQTVNLPAGTPISLNYVDVAANDSPLHTPTDPTLRPPFRG